MPRRRTIDHPDAVHHVIVRGAGRHEIFRDDDDREAYCDRLALVFREDGASCLAWALMPNHVHLVVRTGAQPLARVMQRVGMRYSLYFNKRYERVGHLLQGRYRAIAVADDAQLATLVRYVHGNPLRAGIVSSLEELAHYRWTGHAALIGRTSPALFHDARATLELFDDHPARARTSVHELMRCRDETVSPALERPDRAIAPVPDRPHPVAGVDPATALPELITRVCGALRVREADLLRGSRCHSVSRARATIAHVAFHQLGVSLAETARALGVSRQSLWRGLARGHPHHSATPPTS